MVTPREHGNVSASSACPSPPQRSSLTASQLPAPMVGANGPTPAGSTTRGVPLRHRRKDSFNHARTGQRSRRHHRGKQWPTCILYLEYKQSQARHDLR